MICPECGKDYREGRQCPKLREVVCIDCCRACENYRQTPNWGVCSVKTTDPLEEFKKDLEKKKARVRDRSGAMRWLYKHNKPNAARLVENEINMLEHECRLLAERIKKEQS